MSLPNPYPHRTSATQPGQHSSLIPADVQRLQSRACAQALPRASTPLPLMRSKRYNFSSSAVGPDFAAMRECRDARHPTIRDLQHRLGIVCPDRDQPLHEQMLEAYGFRQLIDGVFEGMHAALDLGRYLLAGLPDIHLGPRACAAASLPSRAALDKLVSEFAADLDYWISPATYHSADTRGLLIVFGEDHYDASVRALSKRLMREFRPARGDRFFMEGAEAWICDERIRQYKVRKGSCRLLEKDSPVEAEFLRREHVVERCLQDCLDYVRTHAPGAMVTPSVDDGHAVDTYLKRWIPLLPAQALAGFEPLKQAHHEALQQFSQLFDTTLPQRDQHMADELMREIGPGWNFAIVGANHLKGLRERLSGLPCVFMLPRVIADKEPGLRLPSRLKDEL
ncbi:MAG: hypothetical protein RL404_863 [Pseudomonadota bacterium]|jgi:hypothetical protein